MQLLKSFSLTEIWLLKIFYLLASLLGAVLFYYLFKIIIRRFVSLTQKGLKLPKKQISKRVNTLSHVLENVVKVILFFVVIFLWLRIFNLETTPLVAGVSVFSIVIAFSVQSLLRDVINGFFILLENQFNVGDRVKIGNFEGEVEKMTLRVTVLKDEEGNLHYIPNSEIRAVTWFKKG
jgi:small conductance mechanosensitive channel